MTDMPLKVALERGGQLLELRLARPKANIIDATMIHALDSALAEHAGKDSLKAVLLSAEGPHFSFGASVEEHLPDQCAAMLKSFHQLILRMVDSPVPILVAVHGQCLGGGLEVAAAAHLIFAGSDVNMGQPEIKLGVFAPAASCLLPMRIGQARAESCFCLVAVLTPRKRIESAWLTVSTMIPWLPPLPGSTSTSLH